MNRRRDKALALILVMTVILALAIIATPFVLSMILQERTGTAARYLSQADYGADGAKNYAMWRLIQSVDYIERRGGGGAASSYYYDTETEFDIRLDSDIANKIKLSDPKGSIWGVTVQDEQGKLNTHTCGEPALRNLNRMVDARVINLKDYLTLYSGRDATWIAPQKIRDMGFQNGNGAGGGFTVDNLHVVGKDSRFRASKQGMKPLEGRITGNSLCGGGGNNGFSTDPSIQAYVGGVIEVEGRHPVNINTAKRETLTAMFEGVQLYNDGPSQVTRSAAEMLATRCVGRNFKRMEEFLTAVGSSGLNPRQKLAVVLNAVCPNAGLLNGTGTAPICFKSYDVYTLEAFASMNNPAGTEVAGRGYREVVSVSPPSMLKKFCESQYDFNQMMSVIQTALQGIDPKFAFPGYPFGNRLVSLPRKVTEEADVAIKPNQAYITVKLPQDERGMPVDPDFERMLDQWPDPHCRDHYSAELEGKKMGGPESFSWRRFFAPNTTSEDDLAPGQRPDTGSGGFEMWTKFDGSGDVTLFEINEAQTTNRVSLRVDGGDLVLTAADGTIPYQGDPGGRIANGVAEIRWPNFKITPDTWTHFGAYWKSNRYADLALLVDGLGDPAAKFMHYTAPGGQELMTKLGSAMGPTSTNLILKNSGILPQGNEPTPLLIGEEVVTFDGSTCLRGTRGSRVYAHPQNATVSLFGYSSKVQQGTVTVPMGNLSIQMQYNKIPATNATTPYNFGANPIAIVAGDKQDNTQTPPIWQIDMIQNQIGVTLPPGISINDFPDRGYLRIGNEVVFYTARSTGGLGPGMPPSSDKFTGVQRGQLGTMAVTHRTGENVDLWSVAANNANNFPCGAGGPGNTQGTIIQIGDEWFGPVQPVANAGGTYWVSFLSGTNPLPLRRGTLATVPSAHSTGDAVIPTFLTTDINTWPCRGFSVGIGDRITLTDRDNAKQTARVRRIGLVGAQPGDVPTWPGNWGGPNQTQIAALYDGQNRDWTTDPFTRLLKFPSGELLSRPFLETVDPKVTIGPWGGSIDELKAFASTKGRMRVRQQCGDSDSNIQTYQHTAPYRANGGLVKIGDEYIGYGTWNNGPAGALTGSKRGQLNSPQELHDQGDQIFYLQWIPVGVLSGNVTATDKVLDLQEAMSGDAQRYQKGYVLVENEMMLFEWNGGGSGKTLSMPAKWDNTTGLYRGMFGTQPQNHNAGTMVYGMPYRAYDTYKQREFDNTMVYFQYSTKMELADWKWFKWTQEIQPKDDKIVIHAIACVDRKNDFWETGDHVFESTTGGSNVPVNRTGYQYDAGQFDVRFYFEYKQGSFDSQNMRNAETWKRYPKIKDITVEYDRPSQTLHHEDR